ncbi:putative RNA-recognition motif (RRM) Nup35-type domain, nucleoporin, NUP53 [Helianthus annuus]|uniref:Nuclear pore complex protein NUP35 n=1 Tax=Helianthus annuus TaxID=4232 RepID=A0A251U0H5_HELAN|nr:nuclear pore complex protein NUP35 [Helianthus annuus]KAF5793285.1 putative RNA-recognition motif (RRM) Nup35-type domain, nucleoporin, NUP53 [Helianthus annuus]KAJ0528126.1 putative RNA-recognition motif (RRM) domain, nucleoporin, NUP53 [Helianthus annuus]KAJ0544559.1 putative RNA-recognition motif (RRM) domain, nucleoporin, NUP53 [Helianthus annuus]
MSSTIHRTPKSTGRQSLFFNDLATPVSNRRSGSAKFTTPGQAAAVSALWRENFATSDLPPPPMFTLEDRSDFSPESGIQDYPLGSPVDHNNSNPRTPAKTPSSKLFSTSPGNNNKSPHSNSNPSSSSYVGFGNQQLQSVQSPVVSSSWWSAGGCEDKGKGLNSGGSGSPVDGVVQRQQGGLLTLPPPREVARPDVKRNSVPVGVVDEEEWVTVYGFSPADTNLVLREFEKCGVILKHVLGPRDSNWMHILYQSRFDAQKALSKNGMQLNGALIIGVKPVDPMQRQSLSDRLHNQGFMPIPPSSTTRKPDPIAFNASTWAPNQSPHSGGTMASPAKSMVSKIVDLMFGL